MTKRELGSRALDPARRAGNATGTSPAIATVRIASDTESPTPEPNWANKPPTAGPTSVPTPHIADTNAEALVHNSSAVRR